jgi:hypothetical protein
VGGYFKPLRRKIGVVALVMALMCLGGWARSLVTINRFTIQATGYNFNWLASFNGSIAWQRVVPVDASKWSTDINEFAPELFHEFAENVAEHLLAGLLSNEDKFEWKHRLFGFEIGEHRQEGSLGAVQVTIWKLSYWLLITPLTLLSAFLLLSKSRKSTQKKTDEPNS